MKSIKQKIQEAMPEIVVEQVFSDVEAGVRVSVLLFPRTELSSVHLSGGETTVILRVDEELTALTNDRGITWEDCAPEDDLWDACTFEFSDEHRNAAGEALDAIKELGADYV